MPTGTIGGGVPTGAIGGGVPPQPDSNSRHSAPVLALKFDMQSAQMTCAPEILFPYKLSSKPAVVPRSLHPPLVRHREPARRIFDHLGSAEQGFLVKRFPNKL